MQDKKGLEHLVDALERCENLPSLSTVAVRLIRLCKDEDINLAEVSAAVTQDPALVVNLLRTVNSAFYGLRQEVRSVSHALTLLGPKAIRTLALSFSLAADLKGREVPQIEAIWRHGILRSASARRLAKMEGRPDTEEVFLTALLQGVGVLALLRTIGSSYGALLDRADGDHLLLAKLEQSQLGTTHTEVAAWLLDRWGLPETYSTAIVEARGLDVAWQNDWKKARQDGREEELAPALGQGLVDRGDVGIAAYCAVAARVADVWFASELSTRLADARAFAAHHLGLTGDGFTELFDALEEEVRAVFEVYDAPRTSGGEDAGRQAAGLLKIMSDAKDVLGSMLFATAPQRNGRHRKVRR